MGRDKTRNDVKFNFADFLFLETFKQLSVEICIFLVLTKSSGIENCKIGDVLFYFLRIKQQF